MSQHSGSCHCGGMRLVLRDTPSEAGECNCSICRRTAGLWHYCPPDDLWHCPTCGCMTHWTPTDPAYPRMGVNLRMFDPSLWRELPRRLIDGASF